MDFGSQLRLNRFNARSKETKETSMVIHADELKKGKMRLEICYDRDRKIMEVYANGKKLKRFKDDSATLLESRILSFIGRQRSSLALESIHIYEWAGEGGQQLMEKERDQLTLVDSQILEGSVVGMEKDKILIETDAATLKLGFDKVQDILFGEKGKRVEQIGEGSSQLLFKNGTTLTMALDEVDQEEVRGATEYVDQDIVIKKRLFKGLFLWTTRSSSDLKNWINSFSKIMIVYWEK